MPKTQQKVTSLPLYLALGVIVIAAFGLGTRFATSTQVTRQSVSPVPLASPIPKQELPQDWYLVERTPFSIALPPDWQSYVFTHDESVGLCPKTSCQDARVWVEIIPDTTVSHELTKLTNHWYFKKYGYTILPTTVAKTEAMTIRLAKDKSSFALAQQMADYILVQRNSTVIEIGYDRTNPLHQQIVDTLVLK